MDVTRIIAIRHGETDWNVATRIQGSTDIPLNETGRQQATQAAMGLKDEAIDAIYSSHLSRAHDTAKAIATHHGLIVHTEPDLQERQFGHFEGLSWQEIEQQHANDARAWRSRDPHFTPTGGESLLTLRHRIMGVVNVIAAQHIGQQIVIATHGGVLDVLYRLATGQTIEAPRTWHLGNAAINRLIWTPDALTMVTWGEQGHLNSAALPRPA